MTPGSTTWPSALAPPSATIIPPRRRRDLRQHWGEVKSRFFSSLFPCMAPIAVFTGQRTEVGTEWAGTEECCAGAKLSRFGGNDEVGNDQSRASGAGRVGAVPRASDEGRLWRRSGPRRAQPRAPAPDRKPARPRPPPEGTLWP